MTTDAEIAAFDRRIDMVLSACRDRGITIDRFCRIMYGANYADRDPRRVLSGTAVWWLEERAWRPLDGVWWPPEASKVAI